MRKNYVQKKSASRVLKKLQNTRLTHIHFRDDEKTLAFDTFEHKMNLDFHLEKVQGLFDNKHLK